MRIQLTACAIVLSGAAAASAQTAPVPTPASAQAAAPDTYSYQTEGRRDPFLNLLNAGNDSRNASKRGDGPNSFTVGEISVRGVMQTRAALVAMVQGPDNKTYLVHQGDKLADGVVKTVTPQGLIVVQEINDPLSVQKQREVRKLLRSLEDAKESQ